MERNGHISPIDLKLGKDHSLFFLSYLRRRKGAVPYPNISRWWGLSEKMNGEVLFYWITIEEGEDVCGSRTGEKGKINKQQLRIITIESRKKRTAASRSSPYD